MYEDHGIVKFFKPDSGNVAFQRFDGSFGIAHFSKIGIRSHAEHFKVDFNAIGQEDAKELLFVGKTVMTAKNNFPIVNTVPNKTLCKAIIQTYTEGIPPPYPRSLGLCFIAPPSSPGPISNKTEVYITHKEFGVIVTADTLYYKIA